MKLKMNNFPYSDYKIYIENYKSTCHTDHYDGKGNKEFFKGMLNLSQYRCFYCGESLITNSISSLYYEREHIINKKYYGRNEKETKADENKSLNKCKWNLIPICKTCNSLKKHIITSNELVDELNDLEKLKQCSGKRKEACTEFSNCFDNFKSENFDPFHLCVEFDILHKVYLDVDATLIVTKNGFEPRKNGEAYISQFKLNNRTKTLFLNVFNNLYDMTFNFPNGGFIKYLKRFSSNLLEDELVDYLANINLINDYGTVNTPKLNNLIETIVLLEEFE